MHDPSVLVFDVRLLRLDVEDLTGFVLGTADDNARWRANYRLEGLEKAAAEKGRS